MSHFEKIIDYIDKGTIRDILQKKIFLIPPNQRPYSWDTDNWEELWQDILDTIEYRDKDLKNIYSFHFFGPAFFMPVDNEKYRVLDGQQRLVTITILFSVILDLIQYAQDNGKILQRETRLIPGHIDQMIAWKDGSNTKPKIELGGKDGFFFEILTLTKDKGIWPDKKLAIAKQNTAKISSRKKMRSCYDFFLKRIAKQILGKDPGKKINEDFLEDIFQKKDSEIFLNKIFSAAADGFFLLHITVPDQTAGYEIFETLNQRGEQLLAPDLFKNLLFQIFSADIGEQGLENIWAELLSIIDTEKLDVFLRHYWLSNYEFTRQKNLFRNIKKKVSGITKTEFPIFMGNLLSEARIYAALGDPSDKIWSQKNEVIQLLEEIVYLNYKQALPLFLSAYVKYFENQPEKFTKLLKVYRNYCVRKYTILGKNPNELEEDFSRWAIELRKNEKEIDDVIEFFDKKKPKDDEIKQRFLALTADRKVSRYILIKLNDSLEKDPLRHIWKNRTIATIEHVIPQSPDTEWKKHLEKIGLLEELDTIIDRIGNLTILDDKSNEELGNKPYAEKLKIYLKLDTPINKHTFSDLENFDRAAIKERENRLAKLAIDKKIWG